MAGKFVQLDLVEIRRFCRIANNGCIFDVISGLWLRAKSFTGTLGKFVPSMTLRYGCLSPITHRPIWRILGEIYREKNCVDRYASVLR